jgi:subfamily B ATP-binding cassette protein MsbA
MKNFGRLLRFAWPYRVRFGLSLVCASLVAITFGANIGAVYPLLQILTKNQNCQSWIADTVESTVTDVQIGQGHLEELDYLKEHLGQPVKVLRPRLDEITRI